jgi:hypothetical protein
MSQDFTETSRGICKQDGCAFLTVWTSIQEKFVGKWVITEAQSIVGIASESYLNNTSVVVYNVATEQNHSYYIGFVNYV